MKLRKIVVISILFVLGIACAGAVIGLYNGYPVRASVPEFAAGLGSIPSDYQFVFGVNVRKFAQSPAFSKLQQGSPVGSDLSLFIERTGLDPVRDIAYLVGAGSSKRKGIVIVTGVFRKDAITEYIRSKSTLSEQSYGGVPIMMIPDPKTAEPRGIAFVNDQALAMGDLESLKGVLDLRGRESSSVLYSETLGPLIRNIGGDDMFWFAGDASGVIANAAGTTPLTSPLMASSSSIKSIFGSMNFGEALTGKITATAFSQDQALKLADVMRGMIAFGQVAGARNPNLKSLLSGFVVTQDMEQVRLELNIPAELLTKMGQRSSIATD